MISEKIIEYFLAMQEKIFFGGIGYTSIWKIINYQYYNVVFYINNCIDGREGFWNNFNVYNTCSCILLFQPLEN